mgnify:CR=1 FL=1
MRASSRPGGGYRAVPPTEVKAFPELLRAAGYYNFVTEKLDYQFSGVFDGAPPSNWDDADGDWRGRATGQPFFAQISIFDTHESQLFGTKPPTLMPNRMIT